MNNSVVPGRDVLVAVVKLARQAGLSAPNQAHV